MPRHWQTTDAVETVYADMVEQFGNIATYNVVDGCEVSYSGTDLGVTVSAGNITHNGTRVAVAAGGFSLVPDATNPQWTWVAVDSAGAVTRIGGTAAADPVPWPLGDYVPLALVKVEPSQTVAAWCEHKIPKRLMGPTSVASGSAVAVLSADVAATGTMAFVPGFALPIAANTTYLFRALIFHVATAAADYSFQFDLPAGVGGRMNSTYVGGSVTSYPLNTTQTAPGYGTAPGVIRIDGALITGSSAGDLKFEHRSTSGTLKAKSRIELY